ncbi:MAG: hypothetical protein ABJG94_04055, partial [Nitratireductor sp.]
VERVLALTQALHGGLVHEFGDHEFRHGRCGFPFERRPASRGRPIISNRRRRPIIGMNGGKNMSRDRIVAKLRAMEPGLRNWSAQALR